MSGGARERIACAARGAAAVDSAGVELAVIGAGPAGTSAAIAAAERGVDVALFERAVMPRTKVCGGCLNATAIRALASLGMADWLAAHAAPVQGLVLRANGRVVRRCVQGGRAVDRAALDAALVERARAVGVAVHEGVVARVAVPDGRDAAGALRCVTWSSSGSGGADAGSALFAPFVCVADGLGGRALRGWPATVSHDEGRAARTGTRRPAAGRRRAASRVGVGLMCDGRAWSEPVGVLELAFARGGYLGAIRLTDGSVHIGGAVSPNAIRDAGGPGAAIVAIADEAGATGLRDVAAEAPAAAWSGSGAFPAQAPWMAWAGVLRLGDARGYVEPVTGEGIAWALTDGIAAGRLLGTAEIVRSLASAVPRAAAAGSMSASNPSSTRPLVETRTIVHRRWRRQARRMRRRAVACRVFAGAVRRPRLTSAVLAVGGRAPWLMSGFVHASRRGRPDPEALVRATVRLAPASGTAGRA